MILRTMGGMSNHGVVKPNTIPSKPHWILFESVAYMLGHGIHWYSREGRMLNPQSVSPGVSCVAVDDVPMNVDHIGPHSLSILADRSFDWIFIDHYADDIPTFNGIVPALLKKLKPGGHVISLSKKEFRKIPKYRLKREVTRDGLYLSIYKNAQESRKDIPDKRPRVCISRYGALGDLVQLTPLIRVCHEDGYHVTLNVAQYSRDVIRENPYIDNIISQEREAIPNHWLGEYWEYWGPQYDKYINLSESVEGALLKVEGRRNFYTSKDWRHQECDINYQDYTMKCGGYPDKKGLLPELYFSKSEEKRMRRFLDSFRAAGKTFLIMCPLRGSSHHKKYPLLGPIMAQWLKDKPDAHVFLTGDPSAQPLAFEHPQVTNLIGSPWTFRDLMLMTSMVSVVLGPETGMLNAASAYDVPKIIYLSHSTPENLTKYWTNTQVLVPDTSVAPCYPCHQLHYTLDSCPLGQLMDQNNNVIDTGPVCASGAIKPDSLTKALDNVYLKRSNA